jgi:hypothetical protein
MVCLVVITYHGSYRNEKASQLLLLKKKPIVPTCRDRYELWKGVANVLDFKAHERLRVEWMVFYYTAGNENASLTAKHFGISRKTFHKWRSSSPPYVGCGLAPPLQAAILGKLSYYKYKEGEGVQFIGLACTKAKCLINQATTIFPAHLELPNPEEK